MAWKTLTETEVYDRLSDPEMSALKTSAINSKQKTIVQNIIDMVIMEWRGGLRKYHILNKGMTIPQELEVHVLADIRYRLFTRLPAMKPLLDELRVDEWKEARRIFRELKNMEFENPDDPEENASLPNTGVEVANVDGRIWTRKKLRGI